MKAYIKFAFSMALTACLTLAPKTSATIRAENSPLNAKMAATPQDCGNVYVVRPGDTLRSIAQKCHVRAGKIQRLNHLAGEVKPKQRLFLREIPKPRPASARRPEPKASASELHPRVLPTPKPRP